MRRLAILVMSVLLVSCISGCTSTDTNDDFYIQPSGYNKNDLGKYLDSNNNYYFYDYHVDKNIGSILINIYETHDGVWNLLSSHLKANNVNEINH